MPITVVFRPAELDTLLNAPGGAVGRDLNSRARRVMVAAKAQAGEDTGRLKKSIHVRNHNRTGTGQSIEVGSSLNYAVLHHNGTRPHLMVVNRDKVFRFTSGSRVIYTHTIRHPGTQPNRYLTDNLYLIR
jgi:hypothetical protein